MPTPICGYIFDGQRCCRRGPHRCPGRVKHVVAFFAELLRHTKAPYAGQPFVPTGWQRNQILTPLFGEVVYNDRLGRYVRRYRILYLSLPRKNGKTELLAGLVLYLLVADGEAGAEIYGLALDRDQAGLVYAVVKQMVRLHPALAERLTVLPSTTRVTDDARGSFYAVVAGDAPGTLGLNPSGAYIDELLTQPDRELYDAIRTGMGTRAQPLLMLATTADNDPAGFAASEREWSMRVLENPDLEPERLVVIYAAPADSDWTKPATWAAANPALDTRAGGFLNHEVIAAECRTAINSPAAERAFRQYRLNQPVNRVGRAVALPAWDAADTRPYDELAAALEHRECYAGLDLAATSDLAVYALDFPDGDGGHSVLWRHFTPAANLRELNRRTAGQADVWVGAGLLTVTEGSAIDYDAITVALEADRARFDIREVAFDQWGSYQLQRQLLDDGWPLISFRQGFSSMSSPTKELLRLVLLGTYRHGRNPILRWQAGNAVVRTDPAGNIKFDRDKSADKIDGLVAGVMALDRALRHQVQDDYATAGFA